MALQGKHGQCPIFIESKLVRCFKCGGYVSYYDNHLIATYSDNPWHPAPPFKYVHRSCQVQRRIVGAQVDAMDGGGGVLDCGHNFSFFGPYEPSGMWPCRYCTEGDGTGPADKDPDYWKNFEW